MIPLSNLHLTEKQTESLWWVRSLDYPYGSILLEHRADQIRYVNQSEDIDWLKTLQAGVQVRTVATAIRNRLHRLEVAWGYDVLIAFNNNTPAKWFHKHGNEKSVRCTAADLDLAAKIIQQVADLNRVAPDDLFGPSPFFQSPRRNAMRLINLRTQLSITFIGLLFNRSLPETLALLTV